MMNWPNHTVYAVTLALLAGCGPESPKKRDIDRIVISDEDFEDTAMQEDRGVEAGEPELRIELTWNTPSDPDQTDDVGADVDLHFRHPDGAWNQEPFDIFWGNPTADWGEEGPQDDPVLQLDDSDGQGPEVLLYDGMASDMPFEIAVHYYEDNGFGPSYPTVRVFRHGEVVFQRDTRLDEGEFWEVGQLLNGNVSLVDGVENSMPHN